MEKKENGGPRWFFANLVEVKLTQEAGGGRMPIVELSGPPGDMTPLHLHRTDDEAWYVLDGEMSFFVGDVGQHTAGRASSCLSQRRAPHDPGGVDPTGALVGDLHSWRLCSIRRRC